MFDRAREAVPAQTQTFSKGWTQFPLGVSPIYVERADGGHVWDVDGNRFIDWPMALGPLLLGHNHPRVNQAVRDQLEHGVAFSLPTRRELDFSERLIDWFPYAERVRLAKNGSDVTTAAVRAARAYTGRDIVLCCGYHGWHDWFIGTTTRDAGVPSPVAELTLPFPFNDIAALDSLLEQYGERVAAIIMEPMGVIEPAEGYLAQVRQRADEHGAVLIFDECWTGFRIHLQGAYGKFGVAPDLACFGKAIGNGVPISVLLGSAPVMEVLDEVFFSFTFGGDVMGIAAAEAVLDTLVEEPVLEQVDRIGAALMTGFDALVRQHGLEDHIALQGYPARHVMEFSDDGHDGLLLKSVFQQDALAQGVLAAGWHAPSYAHTQADTARTLEAYDSVLAGLAKGLHQGNLKDLLAGDLVQPVFRKP